MKASYQPTKNLMNCSRSQLWSTAQPILNLKRKDPQPKLLFWSIAKSWVANTPPSEKSSKPKWKCLSVQPERECLSSLITRAQLLCSLREPLKSFCPAADNGSIVTLAKFKTSLLRSKRKSMILSLKWLKIPWELSACAIRSCQPMMILKLKIQKESSNAKRII